MLASMKFIYSLDRLRLIQRHLSRVFSKSMYGCFKQLFSKILPSAEYRQHWYEENLGLSIFIQILLLTNYNYLIIHATEQPSYMNIKLP